jgi:hypothetical protein
VWIAQVALQVPCAFVVLAAVARALLKGVPPGTTAPLHSCYHRTGHPARALELDVVRSADLRPGFERRSHQPGHRTWWVDRP